MATTVVHNAKEGQITLTSVLTGDAWGGGVAINATKTLMLTCDPSGSFERALYAYLGDPISGPTISTTSTTDDTVSATFYCNGVNPLTGAGTSRYRTAHTGETVQATQVDAGIFSDGSNDSDGIAGDPSITNNSAVAFPQPTINWSDSPGLLELVQGTSDVDVGVFVSCGYAIDSVDVTITDEFANTASGTLTLSSRDRVGLYGPAKLPIYTGTIDCSALGENSGTVPASCTIDVSVTLESGNTVDLSDSSMKHWEFTLDKNSDITIPTVYVDSSWNLPVSGTFSVAKEAIITGNVSGAVALVTEAATNASELVVVMLTATNFSASDTAITGVTSGTLAATGAAVANWSATPAVGDISKPYRSIADANIAGTSTLGGRTSGSLIKCLSDYVQLIGTNNGFGTGDASAFRSIVEPYDQDQITIVRNPSGGSGGNKDHANRRNHYRNTRFLILDSTNITLNNSFSDPMYFMGESCEFEKLSGASGAITHITNSAYQCFHVAPFSNGYHPIGTTGAALGTHRVVLDGRVDIDTYIDMTFHNDGEGNSTNGVVGNHVIGAQAGSHGDMHQMVGTVTNVAFFGSCENIGYQGIFANDNATDDFVNRIWVEGGVYSQIEDSSFDSTTVADSTGPGPIAFHESVQNGVFRFITALRPPAISDTQGDGGLGFIPSNVECDNLFFIGCVFTSAGSGGGTYAARGTRLETTMVNCHTINGTNGSSVATGIRGTVSATSDNYSEVFESPWTDDGLYPSDATSWAAKSSGPLMSRVVADDIAVMGAYFYDGEPVDVGGNIGAFYGVAPVVTTVSAPARGRARRRTR